MNQRSAVPGDALLLTGPVGAGKTAVAIAIGRILGGSGVRCAVIDLDWLGWTHLEPGAPPPDELIARNLSAVWPNFIAAGVERGVMARALTGSPGLKAIRAALPETRLTVVRLTAAPGVLSERLRRRDSGAELEEHLAESAAMSGTMERLGLEDWVVDTDGRTVEEVAAEVARRAGWTER